MINSKEKGSPQAGTTQGDPWKGGCEYSNRNEENDKMRCSKCNGQSRVIDTGKKTTTSVYRRRQCKNCLRRWTTYEMHSTSITTGVVAEILRQDRKLGEQNHHPFKWICIIGEELGEVCRAALEDDLTQYRQELIETAASCVTAVESFDRQQEGVG